MKFMLTILFPAIVELLLSQLFAVVDTVMLGQMENSSIALASVGIANSPIGVLMQLFNGFGIGVTAVVAWAIGREDWDDAKRLTRQSLVLMGIIGFFILGIGLWLKDPILTFAGVQPDTYAHADCYYTTVMAGMPFLSATWCISAILRGVGLTKLPMYYNLFANGINVVLNYLLIYGKFGLPELGVEGAAIATTISRIVGCLCSVCVLFLKRSPVRINFRESFMPQFSVIKRVVSIGIPSSADSFIISIGLLLFSRTLASTYDTNVYAAHVAMSNINSIGWILPNAMGVAATTLVGQMMGAKRPDKARAFGNRSLSFSLLSIVVASVIFFLFRMPIAQVFSSDADVCQLISDTSWVLILSWVALSFALPLTAALRGAQDVMFPMLASVAGMICLRILPMHLVLVKWEMGLPGAWMLITLDFAARALVVGIRYLTGAWMKKTEKAPNPS